ncbi:MAG: AMP-binding protein [Burkholderiaceae bacterium]
MRNNKAKGMNLSRIVERHAQFTPCKRALHWHGQDISYPALWQRIDHATSALLQAGVREGERVAWLGLNDPRLLVLLFALARIGAMLLPLNYRLAQAEQQQILAHAGARWIFADEHHGDVVQVLVQGQVAEQLPLQILESAGLQSVVPADPALLCGDDAASVLLVYTSGTSGRPKGAVHTQAGLLWNCVNASHAQELSADDHVLTVLPLFHVGGLCIQTLPALHAGASVTLHRRFEPGLWLRDVQARRPTLSLMVPATLRAAMAHPDWSGCDLSSLRLLVAGSSVVPRDLIDAFHARGIPVGQVYGATETGPVSIYLRRDDAMRVPGSTGKAGLHVRVRLVDVYGRDVTCGEVGEVWIQAPNLMREYWREPDHPSFQQGWFHSGDLARQDADGFYWVVGRSTDMIISGGENIYPAEIENLLVASADIAEVAVMGQKDPTWGEVVVAVVVPARGAQPTVQDVQALLEGRIARFKIPRRVVFLAELPKTALGKIQKPVLLAALNEAGDGGPAPIALLSDVNGQRYRLSTPAGICEWSRGLHR